MSDIVNYIVSFSWIPFFIMGILGLILGFLLSRLFSGGHAGDLTAEGEGALRAEADSLRTRVQDLEGKLATQDTELTARKTAITDLESKLAATGTSAASPDEGDDETYALEWRNRYLAARVKYLEGRLAEVPAPTSAAAPAKAAPRNATAAKRKSPAPKKAAAKKASAPKVLYTDGPTDGDPDDLKKIKGIGPKFEKDLNDKGIYYFRQIASWKKKDIALVEDVIDSIPGRIERDEWVPQAKGLTGGTAPKAKKKPGPKPGTKRGATNKDGTPRKKPGPKPAASSRKAKDPNAKYYENVKKFDSRANKDVIDSIVKYCGVALRSRDSTLVACSDPSELETVSNNFCVKKLGLSKEEGDTLVKDTCEKMKSQRFKNRVTFYYLCAKKAKKLDVFK